MDRANVDTLRSFSKGQCISCVRERWSSDDQIEPVIYMYIPYLEVDKLTVKEDCVSVHIDTVLGR